MGLGDGILTALTLAAGHLAGNRSPLDVGLVMRIATATTLSGMVVFFISEYGSLRGQLIHAERELNLTTRGRLATTHLGHEVLKDAIRGSIVAGCGGFMGALAPLMVGVALPTLSWVAIVVAVVTLAVIGFVTARAVAGRPYRWMLALMLSGVVVAVIGARLNVA